MCQFEIARCVVYFVWARNMDAYACCTSAADHENHDFSHIGTAFDWSCDATGRRFGCQWLAMPGICAVQSMIERHYATGYPGRTRCKTAARMRTRLFWSSSLRPIVFMAPSTSCRWDGAGQGGGEVRK